MFVSTFCFRVPVSDTSCLSVLGGVCFLIFHLQNTIPKKTLEKNGPAICELIIDENQVFAPKLGAKQHADGRITSPALEDLSPFLSKEELKSNMIIDLYEDE